MSGGNDMRASLLVVVVIAALGGLLFGFDTAIISGTDVALTAVFSLSAGGLGFTKASALIGTIFGAMLAGWPSDRFGRRATLMLIALLYLVSAVGSAWAWDWYPF
jgi:MFS family permease